MGASDNRLMFQIAVGDIRKQLDARKREIDKWIKENPATINVGVKFELEDLKSKLQTLGVVFGSTNKEIKALSTEMEKTLDKVNSKLNEAGNSGSNGVGKMTSGARQLAEAMKEVNASREKAVAASNEEANARQNVANIEQNILEARKRIAAIQSGKMTNFKWLEDAKMLKESTNSQKSLKDVYIEKLNGQIAVWLGQQERGEKAITEAVERRVKAENELAAAQSKADSLKQLMERTTTQQRYNNMLADTEKLLERIKAASAGANSSSLLNVGVRDVGAFLEKASSRSAFKDEQNVVANLVSEYNRLLKVYGAICSEEERKAKATDAAARKTEQNIARENAARQKSVAAVRAEADELVRSRKAALQGQGFDLSKLLSLGKDKLGTEQYDAVRNALRSIREELRQIDTIMQRGGRSTGLMLNIGGNTRDYSHVIATAQQVVNIKNQAAQANNQLASSERNVASNVGMTTSALSGQSQVLSDLKTMAMQYVSVWAAKSFINNIIEQGGLLEQQRLSIGAILQDTYEADALFSKIKGLAIKSPFGVTELDAMTKQLSAYGFKYSELYEWTKRLADISAATGTEVSRLALALGHVRSEGALSGYTLRQFAMGNIPMLAKLSEKLGKTTSEIRKMVSRKEIGYDEVLEVFKELTDEGGMFYNAQETMAEALNAKFKNLRDSFQIMYSEMAEGAPGDALKRLAEILTDLSRNWKVLMPMISTGIGLWGMSRLATMAMNYELARTGTYLGVNAIATSKYNVAQLRQIATMGRLRVALMGARTALMSVGRFLASPWTIGFAAVEGLVYLWQRHNQEVSKAKELTSGFSNLASESQKNLTARLADIDPFKEGMSESELKSGIDSMTDTIKNYAANSQEVLNTAFGTNADGKVKSLAEQYQYLREQMEKTVDVYKELARTADAFEFGVNYTDGGWFDDNVESDITDYANAMKEYDDAFTTFTANNQLAVSRSLDALMRMKPELKDILQSLASDSERIKWLYENQFTQKDAYNGLKHQLHLNRADYGGLLGYATGNYLKGQKNEAMSELDKFLTGVEERLKKFGYDFSDNGKHLTENQVGNLLKQSKEWLDKHPEWQNIYDVIQDKLNQRWGIPITPEVEETEKKLNEWQQQMQDWLDKHGSTLKIKPEMSRSDIIKMVHGSIEETQKTIDQTKPILLRFKADLSDLGNLPTGLQTPWGRKQAADYQAATPQNQTAKDFLNEFGLPQPKEKRTSRKEDAELKKARVRLDEAKSFLAEYKKYREVYGKERSISMLEVLFPTTKGKGQKIVDDYKSVLEGIKNSIKLNTDDRKKFGISIDKLISDTALNDAKVKLDRQIREMENYISDNISKHDLYKALYEKTGDKNFSLNAFSGRMMWDDKSRGMADLLRERMGDKAKRIDWDADEQDAEDWFKKNFANGAELFKLWKSIVEITKNNYNDSLRESADAIEKQLTYKERIAKIEERITELQKKRKETSDANEQKGIDFQIQGAQNEINNLQSDAFKESLDYLRFFGASMNLANSEVQRIGNTIKQQLSKELSNGTIKADEYSRTLREVTKHMEASRKAFKGDFMTFLTGGQQALISKRQAAVDDAAIKVAQAEKERQEALARGDKEGAKAAEERRRAAEKEREEAIKALGLSEKQYQTLNKMSTVLNLVGGALDGMQKAAQSLAEMFDALGNTSAANTWSDISDGIRGVSSILTPVNNVVQSAMSGNVSGVVSSVISAPVDLVTGPITAFAKLHDKRRERRIQELKEEVQRIANNTELILKSRQRTLGYDRGELRKLYSNQYYHQENVDYASKLTGLMGAIIKGSRYGRGFNSAAEEAMYNYYQQNGDGNGYKQQLANLRSEREKYMQMYNEEEDKKKTSQAALDEYKQKIAELDDQIHYFALDLANELWGIDMKGWAQQISDALANAFENGTNMAKAFKNTVQDILRSVLHNMLKVQIIEPMMQDLQDKLFGKQNPDGSYTNGLFNIDDPVNSANRVIKEVAKYFGPNGKGSKMVESAEEFEKAYEIIMKSLGFDLKQKDTSSLSASINGVTEETANLLGSYINALRADVAINRGLLTQFVYEYWNSYVEQITSIHTTLRNIDTNVSAIRVLLSENGRLQGYIENMSNHFDRITNGVEWVTVR